MHMAVLGVLWLCCPFMIDPGHPFIHILQGYFTGAITLVPVK